MTTDLPVGFDPSARLASDLPAVVRGPGASDYPIVVQGTALPDVNVDPRGDGRPIRSFDVFDTVLMRRVGEPTGLLRLLAERLSASGQLPCDKDGWVAARIRYEHGLRRWTGKPAKLRDIHLAVAHALGLDPCFAWSTCAAELEAELDLSVAVPGARRLLAEARAQVGSEGSLVFVSDTPHPEFLLREMLRRQDMLRPGDRIYSSAERGATKMDGDLYVLVQRELGVQGRSIVHTGDNKRSDVAAARIAGWTPTYRPGAQLSRYEKLLEGGEGRARTHAVLAGSSRLARLEAVENGVPGTLASVASGVLAPLLIGYAHWVAAQAAQRGIRRLYFVSRDAEVMLRIARPIIERLAPQVECRYLYGSRQPWMLAASALSEGNLDRWTSVVSDFTTRTVLARVNLRPDDVWQATRHPLFDPARADLPLSRDERAEIRDLLGRPALRPLVQAASGSALAVMTDYLRQEGLLDGTPSALVDSGWRGDAAGAFDQVLVHGGAAPVTHLMMGVLVERDADRRQTHPVDMLGWLFDERAHPARLRGFPSPAVLIEMFCAGTEGRVVGYRHAEGGVEPVLAAPRNTPVLEWGLPRVHDVAARVAELCHESRWADGDGSSTDWSSIVWPLLEAFWLRPSSAEAHAWGSFPFEAEVWPPSGRVAHRTTTRDVIARARRGDVQLRPVSSWRAGSAAVSSEPWRTLLRARSWDERNSDRLRRVPRRLRLEWEQRRPRLR